MKKIIATIIICVMFVSFSFAVQASSFPDIDSSHWAYFAVDALVADGTVNGFEDGTFRPNDTVTRAQFVKMIGMGPDRSATNFLDVPGDHWAYEYVMTSGLDPVSPEYFQPSEPIVRNDVVNLLWKRAGSPSGVTAPPLIHRQGTNYDAVSWVYTNGVFVGDDYINLRLSDTLTRAEAAVLIVRMRNVNENTAKISFIDSIDQGLFETAYRSFDLIDKPYDPDGNITNGELALAAARIISDTKDPSYPNVSATKTFEHQYATPINMLCRDYLGEAKDNAEYADSYATVKEAILALTFATLRSAYVYIPTKGTGSYSEITDFDNEKTKDLLTIAYSNGIRFGATDIINPDSPVTMKQFACLALEFDGFSGFYTAKVMGNGTRRNMDVNICNTLSDYPDNSDIYVAILSDVPRKVYEEPFKNMEETPKESYFVTSQFGDIFERMFANLAAVAAQKGADVTFTVYPSLSLNNGNGYTYRVKLTVKSLSGASVLSDIIPCADETAGETQLTAGSSLFIDVETGSPLADVNIPIENVFVSKVIW